MNRLSDYFSAIFFIAFLAAAAGMSLFFMRQTLSGMETPSVEDVIKGKFGPLFEKSLGAALPVETPSRDFWGRMEYALFHQGRKGVVIGSDGWLFTSEEFSCPAHYARNMNENLAYIADTQKIFAAKNVRLAVVVVPAKARVFPQHLGGHLIPSCRTDVYSGLLAFLKQHSVQATDLLPLMQSSPVYDQLYFQTDTHWSPDGAKLAASAVAKLVDTAFPGLSLPKGHFSSQSGEVKTHDGDLLKYAPGAEIPSDHFKMATTDTAAGTTQDIFGDSVPPVTLVGTSYSANPNWNFAGFLKEAMESDVLNMADEGLGPLVVMDKYLQSDALAKNPPQLVIWEMPERYLLMPHGVSEQK